MVIKIEETFHYTFNVCKNCLRFERVISQFKEYSLLIYYLLCYVACRSDEDSSSTENLNCTQLTGVSNFL